MKKDIKVIGLVMVGNALDYYDFMLFAHLGVVITGQFFPQLTPVSAHLLSFLLFAIPFIVRPLGGYLFGQLSDKEGRGQALGETLKYASIASLGIALLPGYETGGVISMTVFIVLRALQGVSLGGEYTTAGTLLLEKYTAHRALISSLVGISGTVGSLCAFSFSWFYLHEHLTGDAWRIAFGLGALATYASFFFRRKLKKEMTFSEKTNVFQYDIPHRTAMRITLFAGMLVGVIIWIPMVYVNFYLTKILHYPVSVGLNATLIALLGSIFLTPLAGYVSDRFSRPETVMTIGAILTAPLCALGFMLIQQGNLVGQLLLVLAVGIFGAPQHAVMNGLFPREIRGRYVNTLFMLGASFGSLVPVLSGYLVEKYGLDNAPVVCVAFFGAVTSVVFFEGFRIHRKGYCKIW